MFHACVQRFDGMDENFLGGELNRAYVLSVLNTITTTPNVAGDVCLPECLMMPPVARLAS